eukprot:TRINITY_DN11584_c0_g1_i1.p1 TRINITY_DN11584_c0_g1~~TRINITY_DN11584_c0_g1_i1.p1  ORF type:complete len:427 (+),score=57.83 TRINITY_DN11584_c0_g1_i1:43-1323(+)
MAVPEELLELFPGRQNVLSILWHLLACQTPSSVHQTTIESAIFGNGSMVWLHGPRGVGKRQMIAALLQYCRADFAFVSCAEFQDIGAMVEGIIRQLLGGNVLGGRLGISANAALSILSRVLHSTSPILQKHVIIVLDDVESWMEPAGRLTNLIRFWNATSNSSFSSAHQRIITLVGVSTAPFELYGAMDAGNRIVSIHVAPLDSESLLNAVTRSIRNPEYPRLLPGFSRFALEDPWLDVYRLSITELCRYLRAAWRIYLLPLKQDPSREPNPSMLHANFKQRKTALLKSHLDLSGAEGSNTKDHGFSLPLIARLLLISSYLASTTVTRGRKSKKSKQQQQPIVMKQAVSLADLLATFKAIVAGIAHEGPDIMATTAVPVLEQLSVMIDLGLIVEVGGHKYQCGATKAAVESVALTLAGFKLELWEK